MESLEKEIAEIFAEQQPEKGPARIFIVSRPGQLCRCLRESLSNCGHECSSVESLAGAKSAIAQRQFDLLLIEAILPDGDGLELVNLLRSIAPATRCIVFSNTNSFQKVVEALRCGAVDYVNLPNDFDSLQDRVESALTQVRAESVREERIARLKGICNKLVTSRQEVSQQVDRLCKDLVEAYQDVSMQMSEVAMASEYRTLLKQELDVEDLLRTSLEYMLTKTGPTNAAVFLPDSSGNFDLGAYVNYDCPRETINTLLEHLCNYVCPQMGDETQIVKFDDADEFAQWIGTEADYLAGCQVVAFSCMHEGECLAVMVLFRNESVPFGHDLAANIDILRPIFAEQVGNCVSVHHRASPSWPNDAIDDEYDCNDYDDLGFGGYAA